MINKKKEVVLIGYSGHAYVVIETLLLCGFSIKGYFEKSELKRNPFNLIYFGNEEDIADKSILNNISVIPAVGNNLKRANIYEKYESVFKKFVTCIHPEANVSKLATIGKGTVVFRGSCINPLSKIGNGVIVNTGSIIEHESIVDDFVHIAPGAVLAGNVVVGQNSFIGANSVIKEGIIIGKNTIIGAGSVVLRDIGDNQVYVGNPAKEITRK
jgi:sugar O-acyltransferase (sialic acid O-acetyltransferase NeuD family)